jgi:hydroxyacylglutathione hydrolase
LPENTQVYPGHDYIENNLGFTLDREPDNAAAQALLPQVQGQDPQHSKVWTLAEEKGFNTFFRLGSASVIAALRERFPDLPEQPDAKTVFVKLRELRNPGTAPRRWRWPLPTKGTAPSWPASRSRRAGARPPRCC